LLCDFRAAGPGLPLQEGWLLLQNIAESAPAVAPCKQFFVIATLPVDKAGRNRCRSRVVSCRPPGGKGSALTMRKSTGLVAKA
jgi:hypothetical protein